MSLQASELILNSDGSIYHLNLFPEDIAKTIITVGDPDRVDHISKHFDEIEIKKQKREFRTHTGTFRNKRITVMSTGMGTDNIDIALNELDALVNIDFEKKEVKKDLTQLDIVRIGTTGSIRPEIPVDTFLISKLAIGFDTLLHYYDSEKIRNEELTDKFIHQTGWDLAMGRPYIINANQSLYDNLFSERTAAGFTATNVGFYGPQGRKLRLNSADADLNSKIAAFEHEGLNITNLEMETSGIYGLSLLMNHRAVSMNLILANRAKGEFSKNPTGMMEELISYCLERL